MFTLRRLACLLLVTSTVAHNDIPEVDRFVSAALSKNHNYTAYHGPTGAGNSALPKATSTSFNALAVVADPAYWLKDITHQGTSAFNPDKTYKVFRNVKDYGAKGIQAPDFLRSTRKPLLLSIEILPCLLTLPTEYLLYAIKVLIKTCKN